MSVVSSYSPQLQLEPFTSSDVINVTHTQLHKESESRLRHLAAAHDELSKFSDEHARFSDWLTHAEGEQRAHARDSLDLDRLNEHRDQQAVFMEDVVAHQADLRFLSMQGQKVMDVAEVRNVYKYFKDVYCTRTLVSTCTCSCLMIMFKDTVKAEFS